MNTQILDKSQEKTDKIDTNKLQLSSYPDIDLSKVRSFEKRQDLYNILHSDDPDHYSRLYLAGFLKSVGYTLAEICSIIDSEASWGDYDARTTWLHVKSLWRGDMAISSQVAGMPCGGVHSSNAPQERVPQCTIEYVSCQDCKSKCKFWRDLAGRGEK